MNTTIQYASRHTPGPWKVDGDAVTCEVSTAGGVPVAQIYGAYKRVNPRNDSAECYANARLIAAAPQMLEVLGAVNDWLVRAPFSSAEGFMSGCFAMKQSVETAIAKAEGQD